MAAVLSMSAGAVTFTHIVKASEPVASTLLGPLFGVKMQARVGKGGAVRCTGSVRCLRFQLSPLAGCTRDADGSPEVWVTRWNYRYSGSLYIQGRVFGTGMSGVRGTVLSNSSAFAGWARSWSERDRGILGG